MTTTQAPPMIRRPYRCQAQSCNRGWCIFAEQGRVVEVRACPFCGGARVESGPGVLLVAREVRGGAMR